LNKTISILGCGWLGKPLAIKLIKKGNLVKGSTTSKHKFKEFDNLGIQPYLISLENLKENINDFLNTETRIKNITKKKLNETLRKQ